jgi:hypothetical protein
MGADMAGCCPVPLSEEPGAEVAPRNRRRRTFIAFSLEALAILAPACFHDDSNANTGEVHMKIHSTNRQMPMLCAAADDCALLG